MNILLYNALSAILGTALFAVPGYLLVRRWDKQRKEELKRRKLELDEHEKLIS